MRAASARSPGSATCPIAAGCDRPMVRDQLVAASIHGSSGLDGPDLGRCRRWRRTHAMPLTSSAAELAADSPLTHRRHRARSRTSRTVLQRHPDRASRIERIVLMGGAIGLGNWTPSAEFNIYADPEAAEVVFGSGLPITMVPAGGHAPGAGHAGRDGAHRRARTSRWRACRRPCCATSPRPTSASLASRRRPSMIPARSRALLDPEVVHHPPPERGDRHPVGAFLRAHGVRRLRHHPAVTPNADVGMELDVDRFWDLMIGAIASFRRLTARPLTAGSRASALRSGDGSIALGVPRADRVRHRVARQQVGRKPGCRSSRAGPRSRRTAMLAEADHQVRLGDVDRPRSGRWVALAAASDGAGRDEVGLAR